MCAKRTPLFFTKEVTMLFSVTAMLLQIMSVLFHLLIVLFFVRWAGLGGDKLRYILRSCEVGVTFLAVIGSAVTLSLLTYIIWDVSIRLKFTTYYLFMFAGYIWWLRVLLYGDKDNWFHDQWRRTKRWFDSLRFVLYPQPVPVYIPTKWKM